QANGDMGWIRVLAFREQGQRVDWGRNLKQMYGDGNGSSAPFEKDESSKAQDNERREAPAPAPSDARAYNQAPQSNPGTGWGEHGYDPVRETRFIAERSATDQIVLRYEYQSGLRALGIFTAPLRDRLWEREHGQLGFAKPPRG